MMKNIKKYIVVAVALVTCTLQAQSQYDSEFTVSLGLGSSALKYQLKEESSKSGFGWQLGAGYSHFFSNMIGISAGLEAAAFGSSVEMKNISFEQQIQTPPGLSGRFLLRANYEGLKESQTAIFLQIPIMLQFRFPVNEKNFLFLGAGIKAGFPVSSKWNQDITKLTTTGYSEYANQQLADMPNHGFSTFPNLKASGNLELNTPVLLALEGGLKWSIGKGKYLYTGVFIDYGLNDIYKEPAANTSLLVYNDASPADYNHNSVLSAGPFSVSGGIKPFAVGIKLKIGIGMGGKKAPKPLKEKLIPKEQAPEKPKQQLEPKPEPVWGWE